MGKSGNRQVQFKQFTVCDDRCAMKVGTDALLLGAWCHVEQSRSILDIGSGSGIITLMLAQRASKANLVGVELELNAYEQCNENIHRSPFADRIETCNQSVQEFSKEAKRLNAFEVVVSNPPFFHDKPKSPDLARNLARHDDSLSLAELLESSLRCLKSSGRLMLVWPMERREELHAEAKVQGLHLVRELTIQGSPDHVSTRFLSEWSRGACSTVIQERMCIEMGGRLNGQVLLSPTYKKLLGPYVQSLD
jgi:tRNA1Val (adenine37-N6)-methyltransferase